MLLMLKLTAMVFTNADKLFGIQITKKLQNKKIPLNENYT